MSTRFSYRSDIDGLRFIAILGVVLFHADLPFFPGGFAGVDVFFVISGFLITHLIAPDIQAGSFSLTHFYQRRFRRLIPALLFAQIVTFFMAIFVLFPGEMAALGRSLLASAFYVSNVFFMQEIDYFAQAADLMPMLHTWSLAVEEQFYVIWPLLLLWLLSKKRDVSQAFLWLLLLIFASFALAMWSTYFYPQMSFYSLPTRLWELAAGGVLALFCTRVPQQKWQHGARSMALYAAGLACLIAAFTQFDEDTAWPSAATLLPVLGTLLLLYSGTTAQNKIAGLLRLPLFVYLGKLSYSWYLLHWPLMALFRNWQSHSELTVLAGWALVFTSLALAMVSYHVIEQPMRKNASNKTVWCTSIISLLVAAVFWFVTQHGHGQNNMADRDVAWEWECEQQEITGLGNVCVMGADWHSAKKRWILWGDSHAEHFAPLIEAALAGQDSAVILYKSCPPFLDHKTVKRWAKGTDKYSRKSGARHAALLAWLPSQSVDGIVMAAAWSGYPESLFDTDKQSRSKEKGVQLIAAGLQHTIAQLPAHMPVHILSDVPRPKQALQACMQDNATIFRRTDAHECDGLDATRVRAWHAPTTQALAKVASAMPQVVLHDMVEYMCNATTCPITIDGVLLYRDNNHLRRNFTKAQLYIMVETLRMKDIAW